MTTNETDRRVQRTRQLLSQALIELIIEKGYERVTVQNIVDRANVGRTTFYAHYQDKEALLFSGLEGYLQSLVEELGHTGGADQADLLPTAAIFHHISDNLNLFQAFGSVEFLMQRFHQEMLVLTRQRLEHFEADRGQLSIPPEIVANYLVGALLALLNWWRDQRRPYSPEEMAAMFQQLAIATLDGAGEA